MLNQDLKKEMQSDIKLCEDCLNNRSSNSNSEEIYNILVAKYLMVDKNFRIGIPNFAKALNSPYFQEIKVILEKLKMYIRLDEIPIQYNENAAQNAVIINGNKNKFNSNVGQNNKSEKQNNITANVATEKKGFSSFIKNIIEKIFRR